MKLDTISDTLDSKLIKYFFLFAAASIFGLICFYPDYFQSNINLDDNIYFSFNESHFFWNNDEIIYGPSIREVYDYFLTGELNLKNPTSLINNSSYNIQFLPYIFAGFLSYIFGSVEYFFYIKNLIFPIITFLLCFLLLQTIFNKFYFSLFSAILLASDKFAFVNILKYFSFDKSLLENPTGISKIALKFPSHQFTIILLFLGIISLLKILEGKNYKYLLIFSVVASAYSYIFTFISLSFSIFFIFLYSLFINAKYKKEIFISGCVSLLLSVPVLYFILTQNYKDDLLISLGFTKSQNFSISLYTIKSSLYLAVCLFLTFMNRKIYENISLIIITQLLPLIIFYHLSFYFFVIPEPQHFIINYNFSKVLIILVLFNFLISFINKKKLKAFVYLIISTLPIIFAINLVLYQIELSKQKTDMRPKEIKKILNWVENNSQLNSHFLTIDSMLLHTIPTLTGRYNFIPSMKSLNATDINETINALKKSKKIIGLNKEFDNYINSSCKQKLEANLYRYYRICEYLFHSYYKLDKGSLHYHKMSEKIPSDINIPEKNKQGHNIFVTYVNLEEEIIENPNTDKLPDYIILGPAEMNFSNLDNSINDYILVYSTKNYNILKFQGAD